MPARALTLCFVIAMGACATREGRVDALAPVFATADAQLARKQTPDLYARAEEARRQALATDGTRTALKLRERARRLLQEAIAQARRITEDRRTAAVELRKAQALQERAVHKAQALTRERALAHAQAAKLRADDAQRALDRVASDKSRRSTPELERAQSDAALWLCERATLILAAAIALGLPSERSASIERVIAAAQQAVDARAQLTQARAALAESERALGAQRDARRKIDAPQATRQ